MYLADTVHIIVFFFHFELLLLFFLSSYFICNHLQSHIYSEKQLKDIKILLNV